MSHNSPQGKRIALLGCGDWGRHILRDLCSLGCEVSVVARSEESRRRATKGGANQIAGEVEKLGEVDGAVVATPTVTHAAVLEQIMDRQVPVFVEKPLTADPASAASLAERFSDRLFVMDKWRYHPGVELLRDIAQSGELGKVEGLRTIRVGWGNPHSDADCVWILAPHDLSIGLEILRAIPTARSAAASRSGDQVISLIAILGDSPWQTLEVSASNLERRREVQLICADGVAVLGEGYADHVAVARFGDDPEQIERRQIATSLPLMRELEAFLGFLDGGNPPRSSAEEGAEIVSRISELRSLAGVGE